MLGGLGAYLEDTSADALADALAKKALERFRKAPPPSGQGVERPRKRSRTTRVAEPLLPLPPARLAAARDLASKHLGSLTGIEDEEELPLRAIQHLRRAFSEGICKEEASIKLNRLSALKKGPWEERRRLYERFLVAGWVGLEAIRAGQMELEHSEIKAKAGPLVSDPSLLIGNPDCASRWGNRLKGKSMSGPVGD